MVMTVPSSPPQRDLAVTPVLYALRDCLERQLRVIGRPVCRLPITFHQSLPAADACDCFCDDGGQGQGWVRWVQTEPAQSGANVMGSPCADGLVDITVEAGVYRCWPVPQTGPLSQQEEETAALGMLRDAMALRKALQCCPTLANEQWELVREEPTGPQGGCIGVTIQARFLRFDCGCPEHQQGVSPR